MKISQATSRNLPRIAVRLVSLLIVAGALAAVGTQPALAQRDEQRFDNDKRSEDHRDERRAPPRRVVKEVYHPYYEEPRYVYAPPPVVYSPPSAFEFVFPLNFR